MGPTSASSAQEHKSLGNLPTYAGALGAGLLGSGVLCQCLPGAADLMVWRRLPQALQLTGSFGLLASIASIWKRRNSSRYSAEEKKPSRSHATGPQDFLSSTQCSESSLSQSREKPSRSRIHLDSPCDERCSRQRRSSSKSLESKEGRAGAATGSEPLGTPCLSLIPQLLDQFRIARTNVESDNLLDVLGAAKVCIISHAHGGADSTAWNLVRYFRSDGDRIFFQTQPTDSHLEALTSRWQAAPSCWDSLPPMLESAEVETIRRESEERLYVLHNYDTRSICGDRVIAWADHMKATLLRCARELSEILIERTALIQRALESYDPQEHSRLFLLANLDTVLGTNPFHHLLIPAPASSLPDRSDAIEDLWSTLEAKDIPYVVLKPRLDAHPLLHLLRRALITDQIDYDRISDQIETMFSRSPLRTPLEWLQLAWYQVRLVERSAVTLPLMPRRSLSLPVRAILLERQ